MPLKKLAAKELDRAQYQELARVRYAQGSGALSAVARAIRHALGDPSPPNGRERFEIEPGRPLMRRPDGSIAIPGLIVSPDGRKDRFAAIAKPSGAGWDIGHALIPSASGALKVEEGHDLDLRRALQRGETAEQREARLAGDSVARSKAAVAEAARLGVAPSDAALNQIHDTGIKVEALKGDAARHASADAARAAIPAKPPREDGKPKPSRGIEAAVRLADPNALVESRGGKLLRITVATAAIAEAIDPNAIATSQSSKLLKAAAGAARLPNGNLVMGSATALEGLAHGLDRRLAAHDVHLSIEAMEDAVRKMPERARASHGPEGLIAGALAESKGERARSAMRAMLPERPGIGI